MLLTKAQRFSLRTQLQESENTVRRLDEEVALLKRQSTKRVKELNEEKELSKYKMLHAQQELDGKRKELEEEKKSWKDKLSALELENQIILECHSILYDPDPTIKAAVRADQLKARVTTVQQRLDKLSRSLHHGQDDKAMVEKLQQAYRAIARGLNERLNGANSELSELRLAGNRQKLIERKLTDLNQMVVNLSSNMGMSAHAQHETSRLLSTATATLSELHADCMASPFRNDAMPPTPLMSMHQPSVTPGMQQPMMMNPMQSMMMSPMMMNPALWQQMQMMQMSGGGNYPGVSTVGGGEDPASPYQTAPPTPHAPSNPSNPQAAEMWHHTVDLVQADQRAAAKRKHVAECSKQCQADIAAPGAAKEREKINAWTDCRGLIQTNSMETWMEDFDLYVEGVENVGSALQMTSKSTSRWRAALNVSTASSRMKHALALRKELEAAETETETMAGGGVEAGATPFSMDPASPTKSPFKLGGGTPSIKDTLDALKHNRAAQDGEQMVPEKDGQASLTSGTEAVINQMIGFLKSMRAEPSNPSELLNQIASTKSLVEFAEMGIDNRLQMVRLGAIPVLVTRLKSSDTRMRRSSLGLLNMLLKDGNCEKLLLQNNALPLLCDALKNEDEATVKNALVALRYVSVSETVSEELIKLGCLKQIIAFLGASSTNVQRDAAVVIKNMSLSIIYILQLASTEADLRKLEGFPPLLLLANSEDSPTREAALRSLAVLCALPEIRIFLREAGDLEVFVTAMGDENPQCQLHALTCVLNLSVNARNKVELGERGAVARLLQFIEASSSTDEVKQTALRALCNLALYVPLRNEIWEENGGNVLLSSLTSSDNALIFYTVRLFTMLAEVREIATELSDINILSHMTLLLQRTTDEGIQREVEKFIMCLANAREQ